MTQAILDKAALNIPRVGLAQFVIDLAARHKVAWVKTYADEWAEHITRLSDDEVQPDPIENLLIALRQASKVSDREMIKMLTNYLREKESV